MKCRPTTKDAYQLLHDGCMALADVESHGIKIDLVQLERNIYTTSKRIEKLTARNTKSDVCKTWKKVFGRSTNFGSRTQLGEVLFSHMGYECKDEDRTKTGRPKADEETLSKLDIPFVQQYLKVERLKKARATYLRGIQKATMDGFLHPVFSLHLVRTYRSSSEAPNFQNIPIRIPWLGKLIRTCFIARPHHQLVEIDYSGIEVCVSACMHKDPRMIEYIKDPTKDMHRDMAGECYILRTKQVSKDSRFSAKNGFVFPEFYGDWFNRCARSLWDNITNLHLTLPDGTSLREHLKNKGINRLGPCDPKEKPRPGTFEKHIQEVENRFWNERFRVYNQWKQDWFREYQRTGRFTMATGFTVEGWYGKNDVINYPIQGPAFHCLLWSLIRLNNWLKKKRMRSRIVGQIHDSIVADVHKNELEDYLHMANKIMTQRLPKAWPWIIVPLEVEADVSPVGGSWYDKKEMKI